MDRCEGEDVSCDVSKGQKVIVEYLVGIEFSKVDCLDLHDDILENYSGLNLGCEGEKVR